MVIVLKIIVLNWAQNGESNRYLVPIDDNWKFEDLHTFLQNALQFQSFNISYKGYNVFPSTQISQVLNRDPDGDLDTYIEVILNRSQDSVKETPQKSIKNNQEQQVRQIEQTQKAQQTETTRQVTKPTLVKPSHQATKLAKQQVPKYTAKPVSRSSSDDSSSDSCLVKAKQIIKAPANTQAKRSTALTAVSTKVPQKLAKARVVEQEESSESDSEENVKVTNKSVPLRQVNAKNALKLHIPTPLEEFQKKKQTWPQQQKKFPAETVKTANGTYTLRPDAIKPVYPSQTPQNQSHSAPINFVTVTHDELKSDPNVLQVGQLIKFKYTFLNLETCEPDVSGLLNGKVIKNDQESGKLQLHKDRDNESMTLSYNEIVELQKQNEGHQQQAQPTQPTQQIQVSKPLKEHQPQQPVKQSKFLVIHDDQFRMVGKQVNHYYSDRNYPKDDFIQQHSTFEDKTMPVKLLLNFPKIKKVLDSEVKLVEIMQNFSQTSSEPITYELVERDGAWFVKKK